MLGVDGFVDGAVPSALAPPPPAPLPPEPPPDPPPDPPPPFCEGTGTTPASIVRFANEARHLPETGVVSPDVPPAIVNVGVVPISGFAPADGFESFADVPAVAVVKV